VQAPTQEEAPLLLQVLEKELDWELQWEFHCRHWLKELQATKVESKTGS